MYIVSDGAVSSVSDDDSPLDGNIVYTHDMLPPLTEQSMNFTEGTYELCPDYNPHNGHVDDFATNHDVFYDDFSTVQGIWRHSANLQKYSRDYPTTTSPADCDAAVLPCAPARRTPMYCYCNPLYCGHIVYSYFSYFKKTLSLQLYGFIDKTILVFWSRLAEQFHVSHEAAVTAGSSTDISILNELRFKYFMSQADRDIHFSANRIPVATEGTGIQRYTMTFSSVSFLKHMRRIIMLCLKYVHVIACGVCGVGSTSWATVAGDLGCEDISLLNRVQGMAVVTAHGSTSSTYALILLLMALTILGIITSVFIVFVLHFVTALLKTLQHTTAVLLQTATDDHLLSPFHLSNLIVFSWALSSIIILLISSIILVFSFHRLTANNCLHLIDTVWYRLRSLEAVNSDLLKWKRLVRSTCRQLQQSSSPQNRKIEIPWIPGPRNSTAIHDVLKDLKAEVQLVEVASAISNSLSLIAEPLYNSAAKQQPPSADATSSTTGAATSTTAAATSTTDSISTIDAVSSGGIASVNRSRVPPQATNKSYNTGYDMAPAADDQIQDSHLDRHGCNARNNVLIGNRSVVCDVQQEMDTMRIAELLFISRVQSYILTRTSTTPTTTPRRHEDIGGMKQHILHHESQLASRSLYDVAVAVHAAARDALVLLATLAAADRLLIDCVTKLESALLSEWSLLPDEANTQNKNNFATGGKRSAGNWKTWFAHALLSGWGDRGRATVKNVPAGSNVPVRVCVPVKLLNYAVGRVVSNKVRGSGDGSRGPAAAERIDEATDDKPASTRLVTGNVLCGEDNTITATTDCCGDGETVQQPNMRGGDSVLHTRFSEMNWDLGRAMAELRVLQFPVSAEFSEQCLNGLLRSEASGRTSDAATTTDNSGKTVDAITGGIGTCTSVDRTTARDKTNAVCHTTYNTANPNSVHVEDINVAADLVRSVMNRLQSAESTCQEALQYLDYCKTMETNYCPIKSNSAATDCTAGFITDCAGVHTSDGSSFTYNEKESLEIQQLPNTGGIPAGMHQLFIGVGGIDTADKQRVDSKNDEWDKNYLQENVSLMEELNVHLRDRTTRDDPNKVGDCPATVVVTTLTNTTRETKIVESGAELQSIELSMGIQESKPTECDNINLPVQYVYNEHVIPPVPLCNATGTEDDEAYDGSGREAESDLESDDDTLAFKNLCGNLFEELHSTRTVTNAVDARGDRRLKFADLGEQLVGEGENEEVDQQRVLRPYCGDLDESS
eukprot:Lankesteria_metandrocarpae@DN5477_c1_g1_i3.p1